MTEPSDHPANANELSLDGQTLDELLAQLDTDSDAANSGVANSGITVDPTVHDLRKRLDALADELRRPVPADDFEQESDCRRANDLVRELGREVSEQARRSAAAPPADHFEPKVLGQYQLLQKLGEGGMGAVYKALHTRLDRIVALKILPPARLHDARTVNRFQREMKAVGALRHPLIVAAHDAGEIDGTHYLVMEYVDGLDLSELVRRHGPLSSADACELIRQAALALQHAYERGLIHRDIKPSNLMLADGGALKLLDMGLALLEAGDGAADGPHGELTGTGQIMGTIDYMAPEQAANTHGVDIRADLYSLGCTLFKLLTGHAPFSGGDRKSLIQIARAHAEQPIPKLAEVCPSAPGDLQPILDRLLAKRPEDRFSAPAEVAAALAPLAVGHDLKALHQSPPGSAESPPSPERSATTAFPVSSAMSDTQPPVAAGVAESQRQPSGDRAPGEATKPLLDGPRVEASPQLEATVSTAELSNADRREDSQSAPPRNRRRGGRFARRLWLATGVLVLGAVLLKLSTPEGEVTVELGDGVRADEVKIEVQGDGALRVLDARNGWTIDVNQGKYAVKLAGGNDKFQLDKQTVTVTRGGEARVKVTIKPVAVAAATPTMDATLGRAKPKAKRPAQSVAAKFWRPTGEQQAFFDRVAKLSAADQVEAVRQKLREVNPEFDGKAEHRIDGGRVVELNFVTDHVTAIWPVQALRDLRSLTCNGTGTGNGKLADLSPLKGMPLTKLDCRSTQVSDLSPLKGMPLTSLVCGITRVSDLSPLQGMPMTWLGFRGTRVSDLAPLKRMPLTSLGFHGTRVSDLSALKGMPLTSLDFSGTRISDLSPLKGMRLTKLNCYGTQVSDLSPLKGMPLTYLTCYYTQVSDLSPLKGMPLTYLSCAGTLVSDLEPLKGMPLERIWLDVPLYNRADQALLKSLPLKILGQNDGHDYTQTAAQFWEKIQARRQAAETFAAETAKLPADKQIAAVAARLKELNGGQVVPLDQVVENDAVTAATLVLTNETHDVTPLMAFTQLKKLTLTGGPYWLDISCLKFLPLEELTCSDDIAFKNAPVLKEMKTLNTINGQQ